MLAHTSSLAFGMLAVLRALNSHLLWRQTALSSCQTCHDGVIVIVVVIKDAPSMNAGTTTNAHIGLILDTLAGNQS